MTSSEKDVVTDIDVDMRVLVLHLANSLTVFTHVQVMKALPRVQVHKVEVELQEKK